MINMIKADCYRTTKHIAFYVAVGLMLLMIGISIYMISPGKMGISVGGTSGDMALDEMTVDEYSHMSISDLREVMKSREGYKLDRDIQSVNVNLYYIFIFIAAVVIAVDFTGGCVKNTLTSAISRKKYFLSKVVTVTGMCLVLYFANTYIMYFANIIFNGANLSSGLWAVTEVALIQLPAVLVIIIIPVCIAFMAKKNRYIQPCHNPSPDNIAASARIWFGAVLHTERGDELHARRHVRTAGKSSGPGISGH